jgi:hypothetical protein
MDELGMEPWTSGKYLTGAYLPVVYSFLWPGSQNLHNFDTVPFLFFSLE